MLQTNARSILDQLHKVLLFVCLAAMVFCWTQAVRHHPLPVRMGVTAVIDATESIIASARTSVESPWDGAANFLAAGALQSQQTARDRVEPLLPIAETIAARSGGFFPTRGWRCLNCGDTLPNTTASACAGAPSVRWNSRDASGVYLAARDPQVDSHSIAQRLGLRCGQPDRTQ